MTLKLKYTGFAALLLSALLFVILEWHNVFNIIVRIPIIGWFVEYNFPPSDFYVPIACIPICSNQHKLSFVCKYAGRYELDIVGVDTDEMDHSGVEINWYVEDSKGQKLRDGKGCGSFVLASGHELKIGYRYCYDIFAVPRDLPAKTALWMCIECGGEIEKFTSRFPQARIVVVKCFDK